MQNNREIIMTATDLLSSIEPLTQENPLINERRERLYIFFSKLYEGKAYTLSTEQREAIEDDVQVLRTFLLDKFNNKENQESLRQSGLQAPLYQTLILLAQCFPLNERDTEQQILTRNRDAYSKQKKIPINNRFIASNGYWYFIQNSETDPTFDEANIDLNVYNDQEFSDRDKERLNRLQAQWPQYNYKEREEIAKWQNRSILAGFLAFFVFVALIMFAGLGAGSGLVIISLLFILPLGGLCVGITLGWFQVLNKRSQPFQNLMEDSDFSWEENKIHALFDETTEASQITKKPFLSFGFKETLKKSYSLGFTAGLILGFLAAIILLLINPPFISLFLVMCVLYIPWIALPLLFTMGSGLYHIKEYADAVAPPQNSWVEPLSKPVSSEVLTQLNKEPKSLYPDLAKEESDILKHGLDELDKNSPLYQDHLLELFLHTDNLINELRNHESPAPINYAQMSYAIQVAYTSMRNQIINQVHATQTKDVKFLTSLEEAFLNKVAIDCKSKLIEALKSTEDTSPEALSYVKVANQVLQNPKLASLLNNTEQPPLGENKAHLFSPSSKEEKSQAPEHDPPNASH